MTRIHAAAAAGLFLATLAGSAAAQTWGQPIYVSPWGRVVGGTPLSEIETRSYVNTGRWADGYSDQAFVYVPAPVYGHSYDRYDESRYAYGYSYGRGYGHSRPEPRPRPGYRDVWGYNDDRHPSARRSRHHDRDCGCGDVYLYDR